MKSSWHARCCSPNRGGRATAFCRTVPVFALVIAGAFFFHFSARLPLGLKRGNRPATIG